MRWFFVSLLMLNGLVYWYFEWLQAQPEPVYRPGVARIVLREELPQSILMALEIPEPEPVLAEQPDCIQFGPFRERRAVLAARDAAADRGWHMIESVELVDWRPAWWVYLGPFASLAAAEQSLVGLKQRWPDVDAHVIRRGVLIGGISLGLYSQQDRARMQEQFWLRRGEQASVKEIRRKLQQFWLLTDEDLPSAEVSEWLAPLSDGEGREPQQKSCTY